MKENVMDSFTVMKELQSEFRVCKFIVCHSGRDNRSLRTNSLNMNGRAKVVTMQSVMKTR